MRVHGQRCAASPWERAVGPQLAAVTQYVGESDGVAIVLVATPEWRVELEAMTTRIVERMEVVGLPARVQWL
jgi:Dna[CI] antecedent, DciA